MALMTPRNRIVTFRLSDEEFDTVFRACSTTGARSISEFARNATLDWTRSHGSRRGFLVNDLATVARHLEELNKELRAVSERIDGLLGVSVEPARPSKPQLSEPEPVDQD